MIAPRISLVAYDDRLGRFVFVAVPDQRGRYLRTDRSVVVVGCPQCLSPAGVPCRGATGDGWSVTTHYARRLAAKRMGAAVYGADDVLHPEDRQPPAVPDEWMEPQA